MFGYLGSLRSHLLGNIIWFSTTTYMQYWIALYEMINMSSTCNTATLMKSNGLELVATEQFILPNIEDIWQTKKRICQKLLYSNGLRVLMKHRNYLFPR